jgi:hypothetical protein
MNFSQNFFLKHKLVVMNISRDLLVAEPGYRLQTIDYYIEKLLVSRGTVQMAMQYLIDNGCISTEFRGHLGTYLLTKNMDKLWEFTGIGTLTGAMPVPLDPRSSGFATGICDCMRAGNISFNCIFINGSQVRINGLVQGKYDFIVVTSLAEQVLRGTYDNIVKIMELPGCSYNSKYVLLFKNPDKTNIEDGMTIAIDPTSTDQAHLLALVCKNRKNLLFKRTPSFFNTSSSVTSGESDVTIVNSSVVSSQWPEFADHVKEIQIPEYAKGDIERLSTPVILIEKNNYGLGALLKRNLRADSISNSQKGVMTGTLPPNFY